MSLETSNFIAAFLAGIAVGFWLAVMFALYMTRNGH